MKIKLLMGALAAAALLSACGNQGGDSADTTPPAETTEPEVMAPADETTPPAVETMPETAPESTPPESTPPESTPPQN